MEDWSSSAQVSLRTADGVFNHMIWSSLETSAVDVSNKLKNESHKIFGGIFLFLLINKNKLNYFLIIYKCLSGCSFSCIYNYQKMKCLNLKDQQWRLICIEDNSHDPLLLISFVLIERPLVEDMTHCMFKPYYRLNCAHMPVLKESFVNKENRFD